MCDSKSKVFPLRYPDTPVLRIYLLKQNGVIVPVEIHENYPGKNIYRKDPKFFGQIIWTNSANCGQPAP